MKAQKYNGIKMVALGVGLFFLAYNAMRYIPIYGVLSNISDEFGYISNAIFISGRETYEITKLWSAYYSYGYSIILAIFYLLFDNFIYIYWGAMVVNLLFLIVTFLVVFECVRKIIHNTGFFTNLFMTITIMLYSSNIIFNKWMWPESGLTLAYWIIIRTLLDIEEKGIKLFNCFILTLMLGLSYLAHQRAAVLIIAVFICIILYTGCNLKTIISDDKKKYIGLLIPVGILGIFIIGVTTYKAIMVNNVYTFSSSVDINSYSGIASNVFGAKDTDYFFRMILGICGKFWYLSVGTIFLAPIGLISGVKSGFKILFKRNKINFYYVELFIVLVSLGELLLTAIFMNSSLERHDILIYGRYMEFTFGPLLLIAFKELYSIVKSKREHLIFAYILIVSLLLTPIVSFAWERYATTKYKSMFSSAIVSYFFDNELLVNIPYKVIMIRGLIAICMCLLIKFFRLRKRSLTLVCVVSASIWLYNADLYNESAYVVQNRLAQQYYNIYDLIDSIRPYDNIYLYYDENFESFDIRRLQVLLLDEVIVPISSLEDVNIQEENIYIFESDFPINTKQFKVENIIYRDESWVIIKQ